jgi:membrane protein
MLSRFRVPLSWTELLKRTAREAIADDILSLSAQQAYYFFFALFPALLAIISFASFFPLENLVDRIVDMMRGFAPPDVVEIVVEQIEQISEQNLGGLLTIAFLITLWSSSNAVMAMCTTLNAAYDIIESRPWWHVRLTAMALTIGLALFMLTSMALVLAGPPLIEWLTAQLGYGPVFEWTWKILQWPIVFLLISTGVALVYYFAPDAEQDWVWITPGSVIATALWIVSTLGFRFYLVNFGDYNATYGAIGGVMVLLLWFYVSGMVLLLGAELNAEIEHASPYGKDIGEKKPGEKKKIGAAAQRAFEERRAKGTDVEPFADDVNCDLDRPAAASKSGAARPSHLLIGAAALLPLALKTGLGRRKRVALGDPSG